MNNIAKEFLTGAHDNMCQMHARTLKEVNKVIGKFEPEVLAVLEGKNLGELDISALTYSIKNNQIKGFSSYKEMQAVKIDLTEQVVLSDAIKANIQTLQELPTAIYEGLGHLSVKAGKAIINQHGIDSLERCKIKINKQQLELLKKIESLRDYCVNDLNNKEYLYSIIKPAIINNWSDNTKVDVAKLKQITYMLER